MLAELELEYAGLKPKEEDKPSEPAKSEEKSGKKEKGGKGKGKGKKDYDLEEEMRALDEGDEDVAPVSKKKDKKKKPQKEVDIFKHSLDILFSFTNLRRCLKEFSLVGT